MSCGGRDARLFYVEDFARRRIHDTLSTVHMRDESRRVDKLRPPPQIRVRRKIPRLRNSSHPAGVDEARPSGHIVRFICARLVQTNSSLPGRAATDVAGNMVVARVPRSWPSATRPLWSGGLN